jgi:type IV secretory pathway TrbF-like protein
LTCSNVWFAARSHLQIMHIVHDQLGETLGVYAEDGETVGVLGGSSVSSEPTQPELAYALKQWVRDVREVSIDINHEKRAIQHAFDLVARGSQADGMLNAYYAGHQPYQLATRETVNTTDMAAVAPPPADIGKDGLQTWRLQWTEQTVGRDGTLLSVTQQFMTITFTVIPPHGEQDAIRDPNGIHINSFATSEK